MLDLSSSHRPIDGEPRHGFCLVAIINREVRVQRPSYNNVELELTDVAS